MKEQVYKLADWDKAEGVATSEGFIRPFIAARNISITALEVAPSDEVLPHPHRGLPYFEVVLYIVEGELEVIARDKCVSVKSGMAIMAAPDDMGWVNKTGKTVKALLLHSPPPAWQSAEEFLERARKHECAEQNS
jgi:redox-sensitive bicupin YhaK (pirin superfamily)